MLKRGLMGLRKKSHSDKESFELKWTNEVWNRFLVLFVSQSSVTDLGEPPTPNEQKIAAPNFVLNIAICWTPILSISRRELAPHFYHWGNIALVGEILGQVSVDLWPTTVVCWLEANKYMPTVLRGLPCRGQASFFVGYEQERKKWCLIHDYLSIKLYIITVPCFNG